MGVPVLVSPRPSARNEPGAGIGLCRERFENGSEGEGIPGSVVEEGG